MDVWGGGWRVGVWGCGECVGVQVGVVEVGFSMEMDFGNCFVRNSLFHYLGSIGRKSRWRGGRRTGLIRYPASLPCSRLVRGEFASSTCGVSSSSSTLTPRYLYPQN